MFPCAFLSTLTFLSFFSWSSIKTKIALKVENGHALDGPSFQWFPRSGPVALLVGPHLGIRLAPLVAATGRRRVQLAPRQHSPSPVARRRRYRLIRFVNHPGGPPLTDGSCPAERLKRQRPIAPTSIHSHSSTRVALFCPPKNDNLKYDQMRLDVYLR